MRYFAEELLTVSSTAKSLTPEKIDNVGGSRATKAIVTARDAKVNYSYINEPTADNSHILGQGDSIEISDYDNIAAVRFISLTGTDAKLYVTYGN